MRERKIELLGRISQSTLHLNIPNPQPLPQNRRRRIHPKTPLQPIHQIIRNALRQLARLPLNPLIKHLTHKQHIPRPPSHQPLPRLPPRQLPRQHRALLDIHQLALRHHDRIGALPRIQRLERVARLRKAEFERGRGAGLQFAEVEGAGGDGVLDGDGVVEVDHGVDGAERLAFFEEPFVQRFVRLRVFFRGDVAGCFEGVAVQGDARVALGVGVGGEGREGGGCCRLWFLGRGR